MAFNEQNTVEHFIIHQLTGVNLNAVQGNVVKEDAVDYDTVKWKYIQADLLQRDITEVFVEKELKEDAPMLIHQGGIIKEGVDAELDELRRIAFSGKDYLMQMQQRESVASARDCQYRPNCYWLLRARSENSFLLFPDRY